MRSQSSPKLRRRPESSSGLQPGLIDLLDHAQSQLAAFAQNLQEPPKARRIVKIMDHGEAGAVRQRLRVQHHVRQLLATSGGVRAFSTNSIAVSSSMPPRLAGGIAKDLPALGVGRVIADASRSQRGRIRPCRHARSWQTGTLDCCGATASRSALPGKARSVPQILRPALAGNPFASRRL